ncbi:aldo/keto reductase [Haliangium ochraceum]|uniref:Aldo/keto reductase n=1 Tax=Haliangium ochraceum (strain DSM 14365 / JCM 11303 / SMP-2) TaxID=502025 RepID=D0LXM6_HALO1|nr:aldo/keto reductase [Haliangium ochraceum]ACY17781.1 aldo/keto reductase [Haliangium ochraceum DSM 14365]
MERRKLGRTGLVLPAVGLGAHRVFNVSSDAARARCEAAVDAALEGGANFFATSPMYGNAEGVLASSLAERRRKALIATKVWARIRALGEQQLERSFQWFDRVDLLAIHNLLGVDEHLPLLRILKEEGRCRAVGASHYLPSALPDLVELIRSRELDFVEVPYHPLERSIEAELLPEAERMNVGVIAVSPIGRLLDRAPDEEALAPLTRFGVHTWAQVLIKWVLSDPRVHAVITATTNADHMRENLAAGRPPWFSPSERTYVRNLIDAPASRR